MIKLEHISCRYGSFFWFSCWWSAYPNPTKFADVVTSTTHKVLRGPRGGIILTNNEDLIKKFNSAIFPGLQGGPLMHVIAAKAVCFKEALDEVNLKFM